MYRLYRYKMFILKNCKYGYVKNFIIFLLIDIYIQTHAHECMYYAGKELI